MPDRPPVSARLFERAALEAYPTRTSWDAAAGGILDSVLARWRLTPGDVFTWGYAGTVLNVTDDRGAPAVLKIGYPHHEGLGEAIGIEALGPGLAPRLLRQDAATWSMLLETIVPGTRLQDCGFVTRDALRIGGELLARVAAVGAVAQVPRLADVVRGFAAAARARRSEQSADLAAMDAEEIVFEAVDELEALTQHGSARSFVHGDLNPGNLLRSERGFVVVDPKPMVGDACYDLWPLVSQLGAPFAASDPVGALADQLVVAASAAGLDPRRAARWAFARSGLNVSWYLEGRERESAQRSVVETRVWKALLSRLVEGPPLP